MTTISTIYYESEGGERLQDVKENISQFEHDRRVRYLKRLLRGRFKGESFVSVGTITVKASET